MSEPAAYNINGFLVTAGASPSYELVDLTAVFPTDSIQYTVTGNATDADATPITEFTLDTDALSVYFDGATPPANTIDTVAEATIASGTYAGTYVFLVVVDIDSYDAVSDTYDTYYFNIGGDTLSYPDPNDLLALSAFQTAFGGRTTVQAGDGFTTPGFEPDTPILLSSFNGNTTEVTPANVLTGGSGDDILNGTAAGELFDGFSGNDSIEGEGGNDTIFGGDGFDDLGGGAGDDVINPGDNDGSGDTILTDGGNDTVIFSDAVNGFFTVDYSEDATPITVNIDGAGNTGSVTQGAETDTFIDVENPLNAGFTTGGLSIIGTSGNDTFNVSPSNNQWMSVRAGDGQDSFTLNGDGLVRLDFRGATGPINVNLSTGTIADDGFGNAETITVTGSQGVWELVGTTGNDTMTGSAGNESFRYGGGNNTVDGGAGFDRIRYDNSDVTGIVADLEAGTVEVTTTGGTFNDVVSGIERVRASGGDDDIADTELGSERLEGRSGADIFRVSGGNDRIDDFEIGVDSLDVTSPGLSRSQIEDAFQNANDTSGHAIVDFGNGSSIEFRGLSAADVAGLDPFEAREAPAADGAYNIEGFAVVRDSGTGSTLALEAVTLTAVFPTDSVQYTVTGDNGGTPITEFTLDTDALAASFDVANPPDANDTVIEVTTGSGTYVLLLLEDVDADGNDVQFIFNIGGDTLGYPTTTGQADTFFADVDAGTVRVAGDGFTTLGFEPDTLIPLSNFNGNTTEVTPANVIAGGSGDDTLDGTGAGEVIAGLGGNDEIEGNGGNDTILGGDGFDDLGGGAGDDVINPGDNDGSGDTILTDGGNDTVIFSDAVNGFFTVDYSEDATPITVNIDGAGNTGSVTQGAETDTFIDVENPLNAGFTTGGLSIIGTSGNDTFNVSPSNNQWMSVRAGDGQDSFTLNGDGLVRLDFRGATGPINVNLSTGTIADDGFGNAETITVTGSQGVWELVGTTGNDTMTGSAGNESFRYGGGNNTVDGGAGFDRIRYDNSDVTGIVADLEAGTVEVTTTGGTFNDVVSGIERVRASGGDDDIADTELGSERLEGRSGADIFRVSGGNDRIDDFEIGVDSLDVTSPGLSRSQIEDAFQNANDTSGHAIVDFGNGSSIEFRGLSAADVAGLDPFEAREAPAADGAYNIEGFAVVRDSGTGSTLALEAVTLTAVFPTDSVQYTVTGDNGGTPITEFTLDTDALAASFDVANPPDANDTVIEVTTGSGTYVLLLLEDVDADGNDVQFIFNIGGDTLGYPTTTGQADTFFADVDAGTVRVAGDGFTTLGFEPDTLIPLSNFNGNTTEVTPANVIAGGSGDDTLDGTGAGEVIAGLGGNDEIEGNGGNDTILGGDGFDDLGGGAGDDVINPGDNDGSGDTILTDGGNDTVIFSDAVNGFFTVDYSEDATPITVNIDGAGNTGSVTQGAETDTFIDVENPLNAGFTTGGLSIIGTSGNDTFNVSPSNNQWMSVRAGDGQDSFTLNGDGLVRLDFRGATGPINVNLSTGTIADDGFGNAETITVTGSQGVWELVGTTGNDTMTGSAGNESFRYGGGNNTVDGGAGFDRIRYDNSDVTGIVADLEAGTVEVTTTGGTFNDVVSGIERVRASGGDDDIADTELGSERLEGRSGADIFRVSGGNDRIDDFEIGVDSLDVTSPGLSRSQIEDAFQNANDTSGHAIVDFGNGSSIEFRGLSAADVAGLDPFEARVILAADGAPVGGPNVIDGDDTVDDNLVGTTGDDIISGFGGNDILSGGDGNDTLLGGNDDDTITDGVGDDSIDAGDGNDLVNSDGGGNDDFDGGAGIDTFQIDLTGFPLPGGLVIETNLVTEFNGPQGGGSGSDTISNFENVTIIGTTNDWILTGDDNANALTTAEGNDTITGGGGNDTIRDGAGNDSVDAGAGNDVVIAGTGDDTFNGGADIDTFQINLDDFTLPANFVLETNLATQFNGPQGGGAGSDTITNFENVLIQGAGADVLLTGDGNANALTTGDGEDTLVGGAGNDTLDGGAGTDVADYSSGSDNISVNLLARIANAGALGNDTLTNIENVIGGTGNDTLVGDAQANVLEGGNGNDYLLDLSGGADTLNGGEGNDQLQGSGGGDENNGGGGTDEVRYNNSDAAVNVNLSTGAASGGHAAGDTFSSIENLVGSGFNDTLTGDAGVNRLDGFNGNDLLQGGLGADVLFGGFGQDTADFSDSAVGVDIGHFRIGTGGTADGDQLIQIEGIIGSDFSDTLVGSGVYALAVLSGGDGDDLLFDYGGASQMFGGGGNDTMIGRLGADAFDGGADEDVVRYADAVGAVNANLTTGVGTGADAQGDTYVNVENLVGSIFFDTLTGDGEVNDIRGGRGRDIITGKGGNDELYGGADLDIFVYDALDWGDDLIFDFDPNPGREKLDFSATSLQFSDFTIVDTAFGLRIDYADATAADGFSSIALAGIDPIQITADDFIFAT